MTIVAILSPANSTIHSHPKKPMLTTNKYAEGDGDGDIGEYVGEDDGEDDAEDGDGDDDEGDEADGDEWKDCCADHEVLASVAPPTHALY